MKKMREPTLFRAFTAYLLFSLFIGWGATPAYPGFFTGNCWLIETDLKHLQAEWDRLHQEFLATNDDHEECDAKYPAASRQWVNCYDQISRIRDEIWRKQHIIENQKMEKQRELDECNREKEREEKQFQSGYNSGYSGTSRTGADAGTGLPQAFQPLGKPTANPLVNYQLQQNLIYSRQSLNAMKAQAVASMVTGVVGLLSKLFQHKRTVYSTYRAVRNVKRGVEISNDINESRYGDAIEKTGRMLDSYAWGSIPTKFMAQDLKLLGQAVNMNQENLEYMERTMSEFMNDANVPSSSGTWNFNSPRHTVQIGDDPYSGKEIDRIFQDELPAKDNTRAVPTKDPFAGLEKDSDWLRVESQALGGNKATSDLNLDQNQSVLDILMEKGTDTVSDDGWLFPDEKGGQKKKEQAKKKNKKKRGKF